MRWCRERSSAFVRRNHVEQLAKLWSDIFEDNGFAILLERLDRSLKQPRASSIQRLNTAGIPDEFGARRPGKLC